MTPNLGGFEQYAATELMVFEVIGKSVAVSGCACLQLRLGDDGDEKSSIAPLNLFVS